MKYDILQVELDYRDPVTLEIVFPNGDILQLSKSEVESILKGFDQ